ncbi:uncharacterized protein [Mycetomoellerius zeteki]|nr:PREDICTED: uncharacterized protein LOC108726206 [Trachymyrmex zeteki]XP_018309149.1 PREDICTED: uncharacterized protein LOC108726206 [Trachymyrmex zeteki]
MKIPLLILCLAVVYGTCRTYDGDDVIKAIQNNGDYKNYANMPFEKSLARYKRTILSSIQIPSSIGTPLGLLTLNGVRSTDENFMTFINELLTGKDVRSTIDKLSLVNIPKLLNPFEIIQTVINFGEKIILSWQNINKYYLNALFDKMYQVLLNFGLKVFLPGLHAILNKLLEFNSKFELLPKQIDDFIYLFNAVYTFLQMIGKI